MLHSKEMQPPDGGPDIYHLTGPPAQPANLRSSLQAVFESARHTPENATRAADSRAQVRLRTRRREPEPRGNLRAAESRILRRAARPAAPRLEPSRFAGNAGPLRSVAQCNHHQPDLR